MVWRSLVQSTILATSAALAADGAERRPVLVLVESNPWLMVVMEIRGKEVGRVVPRSVPARGRLDAMSAVECDHQRRLSPVASNQLARSSNPFSTTPFPVDAASRHHASFP